MVLSSCIDAAQEKKKKHLKMSDNYFAFGRNSFYLYKRDRGTRYIQNCRTDRYRLSVLDANHSTPANFGGRIHNQHKFPPDKFHHRTTLLCIDDIFTHFTKCVISTTILAFYPRIPAAFELLGQFMN